MLTAALISPGAARACATCFGAADDAQTQGMNAAILVLLGVTVTVLATLFGTGAAFAAAARRRGPEGRP